MARPRIFAALALVACLSATSLGQTRPAQPTVASVTPAGTDLVIGIGAADHLVGVSNYDGDRPDVAAIPHIGDYLTIDWEKLAASHAQILLLQHADDRIPFAIRDHCKELGIRIVNLKIETIDDILWEMGNLADALHEGEKGQDAIDKLRAQLDAVRDSVKGQPPILTLIVTDASGQDLVGPDTFLDEILTDAGGKNAATKLGRRYASVDREMLLSLAPDVIIQLISDGDKTPQVLERAANFWTTLPDLPAVKNNQVHVVTKWYAELPGSHIGDMAEIFAQILHPTGPTSKP